MSGAFVATAISLTAPAQAAASNSLLGIKIAPENDHVNPLPLSAIEAEKRFGQLTSSQVNAVTLAAHQLFSKLHASTGAGWDGPTLYLSHSAARDYRQTNITELKKELTGGKVTLFDPYSLGSDGGETNAVIMAKIQPAAGTDKWTAIAFVLDGDAVQRIVVAPQPWIRLMDR